MSREIRESRGRWSRGICAVAALLTATTSIAQTTVTYKSGVWASGAMDWSIGGQSATIQAWKGYTQSGNRKEVWAKAYLTSSVFDPAKPKPKTLVCRYYESGGTEYLEAYEDVTADSTTKFTFKNKLRTFDSKTHTSLDPDGDGTKHRRLHNTTDDGAPNAPQTIEATDGRPNWTRYVYRNLLNSVNIDGDGNEGIMIEPVEYRRTFYQGGGPVTQSRIIYRARAMRELHGVTHYVRSGWMNFDQSAAFSNLISAYETAARTRASVLAASRNIGLLGATGVSGAFIADMVGTGGGQRWSEFAKPFATGLFLSCSAAIYAQTAAKNRLDSQKALIEARHNIFKYIFERWPDLYTAP